MINEQTYTSLANLRLITVLENLEIADECANLQRLLVTFFIIGQVEQDVV